MQLSILNTVVTIPDHVSEVSLRDRIEFDQMYGDEIEAVLKELLKENETAKEDEKKVVDLSAVYIDRAQKTVAFFTGIELEQIMTMPINEVLDLYENHFKSLINLQFDQSESRSFLLGNEIYWLPESKLNPKSGITFNQIITSKEVTRNLCNSASEKLTALAYLGAIFLKKEGGQFSEEDINIESDVMNQILDLPIEKAINIGDWYDAFTDHIKDNFSVFKSKKKKKKGEIDMTPHFEKWGWISFLNYVANKGTIFYKSNGQSNLENVKQADAYEVLIWASCEKDLENLIQEHHENAERKRKL